MIFVYDRLENMRAIIQNKKGYINYSEARVEEEINGKISLDLSIPFEEGDTHQDFQWIDVENTVVLKMIDQNRDEEYFREFVIKETDLDTESQIKRVYCEDSAIAELNDEKIEEKRPGYGSEGTSAYYALEVALEGSRWQAGHVDDLGASRAHFFHESRMSCIQKILEAWGGEVRFRVVVSGSRIVGRYVDIFAHRGRDRGKRIEIGKDLVALNQQIDSTDLITAIWPRGKGEELEQEEGEEERDPAYGRRISIEDVEWKKELGDPVDKPLGQKWIGDPEALEQWGRIGSDGKKRHKMRDVVFEDIEDPEVLIEEGWKLLQELKKPRVSFDVHMIDLEKQYGHEAVRLGDTVRVIVNTLEPAIRVEARVERIVRYLGEPERTEVTIGNFEDSIIDVTRKIQEEIEEKFGQVEPITWRNSIIDLLNNEIIASNAYMYFNTDDGIILFNRPREQNPNEAMQMKAAGLRIANSRLPNGEFDWRTAITASGINADEITAGKMRADRIGAGILNIGGKDFGAAQLFLRDSEDNIVGHFDGETQSWDHVKAGRMSAPNIPQRTLPEDELATKSLYVHPSLGNDVSGDGSQSKPFRTLQRAIDQIPEVNHATWDIRVIDAANNPISEHLEIRGYRGDGIIRFQMDGVKFTGWIRLSANLHRFAFYGGHYYHSGQGHPRTKEHPVAVFHVIRTNILYMEGCYLSAEYLADHALSSTYGSIVEAYDCYFHRGNRHGVLAHRFGQVYMSNCGGRNNTEWGAFAQTGGVLAIGGDVDDGRIYCPAGKGGLDGADDFFWGKTITSDIRTGSNYTGRKISGTRVTIPNNQILTAYATSVASWRMPGGDVDDGHGWEIGKLYQGAGFYPHMVTEESNGYGGNNAGFTWFGDTNFRTRLGGRTIKDIRVWIRRASQFTPDSPKEVKVWLHNYTRQDEPLNWDPTSVLMDGDGIEVGTYSWGEEKAFSLPISAGDKLKAGEAIGLALFHEDPTQGLEIVPRSIVMEVVYE